MWACGDTRLGKAAKFAGDAGRTESDAEPDRLCRGPAVTAKETDKRIAAMDTQEVFKRIVEILTPFAKNEEALSNVTMETSIQEDLEVNSARLVDIVLEIEDGFDIEISDDAADQVTTVGDAVNLIATTS